MSAIWVVEGICTVECQPGYWEADKVCVQEHAPCKGKKPLNECLGKHPGRVKAREIDASRWSTYQSAQDAAAELGLDKGAIETACNAGGGQVGNYEVDYKDYIRFDKTEDGTCGSITDQDKCEKTTDECRYCKFQGNVCAVDPAKTQTCSNYRWETMCVSPTVHAVQDGLLSDGTCTDELKTRTTTCNRVLPSCKQIMWATMARNRQSHVVDTPDRSPLPTSAPQTFRSVATPSVRKFRASKKYVSPESRRCTLAMRNTRPRANACVCAEDSLQVSSAIADGHGGPDVARIRRDNLAHLVDALSRRPSPRLQSLKRSLENSSF